MAGAGNDLSVSNGTGAGVAGSAGKAGKAVASQAFRHAQDRRDAGITEGLRVGWAGLLWWVGMEKTAWMTRLVRD